MTSDPDESRGEAGRRKLRILSYNIQVGINYTKYRHYVTRSWQHVLPYSGRQGNLDGIARFIASFDVVGLQEVDAGSLRSAFINQTKYLAFRAGFPFCHTQTNRKIGHLARHSLGLLSRVRPFEIREWRLPGRIPGRGALVAIYGCRPVRLAIVTVHLALGKNARTRQLEHLARQIEAFEHVVVMGDFNCRIDDPELYRLIKHAGLHAPEREMRTFPSWRPKRGLDHILVSHGLTPQRPRVFMAEFSDHLPIAVDIVVPPEMELDWGPERCSFPPPVVPVVHAGGIRDL